MRILFPLLFSTLLLYSCSQRQESTKTTDELSAKIQDLKEKYRPGLGEYMIGIQLHHSKLWFAGVNHNWQLADYEIGEIKESFQSIKEVETDRPEVNTIMMIEPALDSLSAAINNKDETAFKRQFEVLTATCNNCHTTNKFGFNVITIPTALPVSNQDFKPKQ